MSSRSSHRPNLLHPPKSQSYKRPSNSVSIRRSIYRNLPYAVRRKIQSNRTMKRATQGSFYMGNMLSAIEETPDVKVKLPHKLELILKKIKRKTEARAAKKGKKGTHKKQSGK